MNKFQLIARLWSLQDAQGKLSTVLTGLLSYALSTLWFFLIFGTITSVFQQSLPVKNLLVCSNIAVIVNILYSGFKKV